MVDNDNGLTSDEGEPVLFEELRAVPDETTSQDTALIIARQLAAAGIPIFVAKPDTTDGEWNPNGGHNGSGYWLPKSWNTLDAVHGQGGRLRAYRPGDALCALMGWGLDVIDIDPRNGGFKSTVQLPQDTQIVASASTPNGGTHQFVRSMDVRSRDNILPGIDVKAGTATGMGRGFAWIAPTVRRNKVTGLITPYAWTRKPDLDRLSERYPVPEALRALVEADRITVRRTPWEGPDATTDDVLKRARELTERVRHAVDGEGNSTLNEMSFKIGEYVGAGQLDVQTARELLHDALDSWEFAAGDEQAQRACLERALDQGAGKPRAWVADESAAVLDVFDPEGVQGSDPSGADTKDTGPTPLHLPDSFWESRPVLKHIRQAAWHRGATADLVLMATLARLSAMVPHTMRFFSGIGTRGSLNLFVAVVGESGIGKSSGAAVAREILQVPEYLTAPEMFRDGLPIGSGEGLAEAFMGEGTVDTGELKTDGTPKLKKVKMVVRHNVFAYVDEGQTLTAQAGRSGATIGPVIRSAWVGELLGQSNASADNSRIVRSGEYSLGMLIGFQRTTAQPILSPEERANGTPQRFVWISVTDPSLPDEPPPDPGHLVLDGLSSIFGGDETIDVDETIKRTLWVRNRKIKRGELKVDDLSSHVQVMALKLSSLLAVLDGRTAVTLDDWALAGQIWKISKAVQADTVEFGAEQRLSAESSKTDAEISRQIRVSRALSGADELVIAQSGSVARCVHKHGPLSPSKVRSMGMLSRHRGLYDDALKYAVTQGWLVEDGIKVVPGPVPPPGKG